MRMHVQEQSMTVHAVAGTYAVLLGMDLEPSSATGLLGFSVYRTDHTEGEAYWLPNQLLFEVNDRGRHSTWGSDRNPIQTFRWGDYSAKPSHVYTYTVIAKGGTPAALTELASATVRVETEPVTHGTHRIFFNRGAISSQWYARRFGNRQPADVPGQEAYRWLSRGLEEGMTAFIGQAVDASWTLRAALYETTWEPVLRAFKVAADAGADVRLVIDSVGGPQRQPRKDNEPVLTNAGLEPLVIHRTHIAIAHNKFVVVCKDNQPIAVWTGSTNVTEGGFFGQLNVGHAVYDTTVAAAYLADWEALATDPVPAALKPHNDVPPATGPQPPAPGITCIFSPRRNLDALDWYAELADQAVSGVFLTAAFGVSEELMTTFSKDKPYLRYVLLDNDSGDVQIRIRSADPDNQVAIGAPIGRGGFAQWSKEVTLAANKHVRFVHTKLMLLDPLGDDPIVITGSANFSKASTTSNDENMLLIRGDTTVADIYLTEFMRAFSHFEFRAHTRTPRSLAAPGLERNRRTGAVAERLHLAPDDSWVARWYEPESPRAKERLMFSGHA